MVLLAALLLQAPALLPPLAPPEVAPSAAFAARLAATSARGTASAEELAELAPATAGERAALLDAFARGGPAEVRLASLVSAGCVPGDPLTAGALTAAWELRDEGAALAALLAPASFPPSAWPALAWIALDPERPASLRAAATSRLLRSGCAGAWPLARSLLRAGTAADEMAPWADWSRSGRYELPKRLLLVEIEAWLAAAGEDPSGCEPNAAWQDQVDALRALEPRIQRLLGRIEPVADRDLARGVAVLLRVEGPAAERARRAAAMLVPHASATLRRALAERDPGLVFSARRALEILPR